MSEIILYIAENGDDTNDGSEQSPLQSIAKALGLLRWEEYDKAVLFIRGTISKQMGTEAMVDITGNGLPPLFFRGESKKNPGVLSAKDCEQRVMRVSDNNTVSIENIVIKDGSSKVMYGGAGVYVDNATFIMESGEITRNKVEIGMGGGVYIGKGGQFVMRGGAITHNRSGMNGGGVMTDDGGSFTMYNGLIANNEGYVYGGGVFVGMDSTFVMHDGIIERNSTGGDHDVEFFKMTIQAGMGGGVYVAQRAEFTMNGGEIRRNASITTGDIVGNGGGVFVEKDAACTINKGAISQNSATNCGGGMYIEGVTTLLEGSIIYNKARIGAGVNVGSGGAFSMKGGVINDNTVELYGGGVNVEANSTFIIEGGYVTRNKTGDKGSAFAVMGTATIDGGVVKDNHCIKRVPLHEDLILIIGTGGQVYRNGGDVHGAVGMMNKEQVVDTRPNAKQDTKQLWYKAPS